MIIPKPSKERMSKKISESDQMHPKKSRRLDASDIASEEKLQRANKKLIMLKENLKQNLTLNLKNAIVEDLKIDFEGLKSVIDHVGIVFGDKTWINEIDKIIENELEALVVKAKEVEEWLPEVEEKVSETNRILLKEKMLDEEGIKSILKSIKETGISAREKQSFDEAIEILKDIDKKILPVIEIHLPEKDKKNIKASLSKELRTTLLKKGKIDEAIKVIDSCCTKPDDDSTDYIESQIEKGFLLIKKGEFNQAITLLKNTLKYEKSLPEKERKLKQSAEIKRVLGVAYRGQGAYQEAVKWFQESQNEYRALKDEIGYHNALWGIGILRYLTGEWDAAIEIWKTLLTHYEKLPDSAVKTGKPPSLLCIGLYTEYSRTLQLSGKFKEAEEIMNKALALARKSQHEYADWYKGYLNLLFSDLYFQQNKIENASQAIAEARQINEGMKSQQKEPINELKMLKYEIQVLLALNKVEEARTKLLEQYKDCKSNWDQASYYHLLGLIEKHELNFGLAKKAFQSSLEKTKEIGAAALSDELMYLDLLVEMSRTGNPKVLKEAEKLLSDLETEVNKKKLSALILECNLLKAHLARFQSNYDKAYQLYSEIIRDADTYHLYRQKKKALEAINLIEQEGQQLRATKDLSVYRYLEDARRILEENS